MAVFLNEMLEIVRGKLSVPPDVPDTTFSFCLDEATDFYSGYRPLEKVVDTTGLGGTTYDYALPADYLDGFSSLVSLQYPFDATSQTLNWIKPGIDFTVLRSPTGINLHFLTSTPATTEVFRFTYTTLHVITTATSTIPVVHERAIINLATGILCETLAAEFAKKSRSTLPDVTLDLRTKSQEYQKQADRFYKLWRDQMGIPADGRPPAASLQVDSDWYTSMGFPPLTHLIQ